jgi:hypothetical protein
MADGQASSSELEEVGHDDNVCIMQPQDWTVGASGVRKGSSSGHQEWRRPKAAVGPHATPLVDLLKGSHDAELREVLEPSPSRPRPHLVERIKD